MTREVIPLTPAPAPGDAVVTDERDRQRTRRQWLAWLTSAMLVAVSPAIVWLGYRPGDLDLGVVALIGLLFVLGEVFTIDIELRRESHRLSFVSVPTVIGMLVLAPGIVVALRLITLLAVDATVRKSPTFKMTVNACSAVIDVVLIGVVLTLFVSPDHFGPKSWLVVAAVVVAGDLVRALIVTTAIGLFGGAWEPTLLRGLWMSAVVASADVAIAVVLVNMVQARDPAAFLVLGLGAFVVFITRAYANVRTRYHGLELLDRFTRALGESVVDGRVLARLLNESSDILHAERAWLISRSAATGLTRTELDGGAARVIPGTALDAALLDGLGSGARLIDASTTFAVLLGNEELGEAIAARLASPDDEMALVVADRSGSARCFDEADVALFETLAVHAGLALHNLDLVDQLRNEVEASDYLATHDVLTSLPNRTLFQQRLDAALADHHPVAVLLIDLDRFKEVNDTLGHHNGDLLLEEVSRRLRSSLGGDEAIARLGGDEFAVLLDGCDDRASAFAAATRIIDELERPFELEEVGVDVGVSIGIAIRTSLAEDAATLLRQADVAMYTAKDDRTPVEIYSPDRDHYSAQRLALVGKLRAAIDGRELVLYYQPQIDMISGEVIGAEALIRWPQPGRPPIPPDEFVYVAEHTGLIRPLTQLVLESAIRQASMWHQQGRSLRVSVNLSAFNLVERNLVNEIARLLDVSGLPPELLMIELTETAVMINPDRSVAVMESLRAIGVAIAIDDFGTGHSSLSYLTGLPATELKIDQTFVFSMGSDPAADTVVRTIVDLGHNLGLDLVAEGVETAAQAISLQQMGCTVAQGFFYSRPLEVRGFELWLAHQQLSVPSRALSTSEARNPRRQHRP